MILPILIWRQNVKKYLYNSANLNHPQGLIGQFGDFIDSIITQLFRSLLTATDPVKVDYLDNSQKSSAYQQLDNKDQYGYVFACNQQKKQQWFQQMSPADQQELLYKLKLDYRQILIKYFTTDKNLKTTIDQFINALFYANIPVPQIIEIHMEIIDEFAKQLRLEGRSDETLLDYRLTLIDIMANLCEAYRCSISKTN